MNLVGYYWVRFYPTANWQITKFWKRNDEYLLKALDWGDSFAASQSDFPNIELGPEIPPHT